VELGKTPIVPFNIFIDVRYHWVKIVGGEVGLRSSIVGLGKTIKKSNVLFVQEECIILA
jgi:hypothetical protein